MIYLIDNGHGIETPGKRSPDGVLREWKYNRQVARLICRGLQARGLDGRLLVPEDEDIPLRERVRRVNAICRAHQAAKCRLISVHLNAAGMGDKWLAARGWSAFVSPNSSSISRDMASLLANAAERAGLSVRRPRPGQDYWTQSLAICRDTICPAVLTENLFMDNRQDCDLLLSPSGPSRIAQIHIDALTS